MWKGREKGDSTLVVRGIDAPDQRLQTMATAIPVI